MLVITEILDGSASTVGTLSMGLINPGAGNIKSSSTALLFSIAILKANENNSKMRIRYTKRQDWLNVITLLYEKTSEQSMIDKRIDEKEAEELKMIFVHYLDKRKEIMKDTGLKVEDVFGDVMNKDIFSKEQITEINNFSGNNVNINIKNNFNFLYLKREKY